MHEPAEFSHVPACIVKQPQRMRDELGWDCRMLPRLGVALMCLIPSAVSDAKILREMPTLIRSFERAQR
eukprot:6197013-Pleurochrysis_carterae.AAC.1